MADFHQTGVITSLHRLGEPDLPRLESRPHARYSRGAPDRVGAALPLCGDPRSGPQERIVEELSQVPYLTQCVLSLSGPAGPARVPGASRDIVSEPIRSTDDAVGVTVLWNPRPAASRHSSSALTRRGPRSRRATARGARTGSPIGYVLGDPAGARRSRRTTATSSTIDRDLLARTRASRPRTPT